MQKLKIHFKIGSIKPFAVTFVGNDACDGDDPMREFLALFFEDARKHILVSGESLKCTFA